MSTRSRAHATATSRAWREGRRAQAREAVAVAELIAGNGMDLATVRTRARALRVPLPYDGPPPRPVVEYVLLVSRHGGRVQVGASR